MVAAVAGCTSSATQPPTAPVSGTVTLDGQPLTHGKIRFYPAEGRMAYGDIENGRYRLTTFNEGDGAEPGQHTVTVEAVEISYRMPPGFTPPPNASPQKLEELHREIGHEVRNWIVPEHYADMLRSPLREEVGDGKNEIDFEIVSGTN